MHKLLVILFYLIFTQYNVNAEDTILVKPNQLLVNTSTKYNSIDDMELLEDNIYFYGYLVIRIDSSSVEENSFYTSIFWIENIEHIEIDSLKYFYNLIIGLISDGERKYFNNKRDNISVFIHYYNLFNYNNIPNKISYLYPFSSQFLTTNLLFGIDIWEDDKTKKNMHYLKQVFILLY